MDQVESEDFFAVCVEKKKEQVLHTWRETLAKKVPTFCLGLGQPGRDKKFGTFFVFFGRKQNGGFRGPQLQGRVFLFTGAQANKPTNVIPRLPPRGLGFMTLPPCRCAACLGFMTQLARRTAFCEEDRYDCWDCLREPKYKTREEERERERERLAASSFGSRYEA